MAQSFWEQHKDVIPDIRRDAEEMGSLPIMAKYGAKTTTPWHKFCVEVTENEGLPLVNALANKSLGEVGTLLLEAFILKIETLTAQLEEERKQRHAEKSWHEAEERDTKTLAVRMLKCLEA